MMKKDISQIQKDFELFGKGVERLEELKQELASLDTSGFESELERIRPLLKQVSAIPQIEKAISALTEKIARRKSASQRKKRKALKTKVRRRGGPRRVRSTVIQKIGKHRELHRTVRCSKEQIERAIDSKLGKARAELRRKVVSALHAEKEVLARKLHDDLKKREALFRRKEGALREQYERSYKERLSHELHRKVDREFNDKLRKRYDAEKKKLEQEYALRREIEEQRFGDALQKVISQERRMVQGTSAQQLAERRKKLVEQSQRLQRQLQVQYAQKVTEARGTYQAALDMARKQLEDAYEQKVKTELSARVSREFRKRLSVQLGIERNKLRQKLTEEFVAHKKEIEDVGRSQLTAAKKSQREALLREYEALKRQYLAHLAQQYRRYQDDLQQRYELTLAREVGVLMQHISENERALGELKKKHQQEYERKLGEALHRKVAREFNVQLRERLEQEKKKIQTNLDQEAAQMIARERVQLQRQYSQRYHQEYTQKYRRESVQLQHQYAQRQRMLFRELVRKRYHIEKNSKIRFRREFAAAESRLRSELQRAHKHKLATEMQELKQELARSFTAAYRVRGRALTLKMAVLRKKFAERFAREHTGVRKKQEELAQERKALVREREGIHQRRLQLQQQLHRGLLALRLQKEKLTAAHTRNLAQEKERLAAQYTEKEKHLRGHLQQELKRLKDDLLVQSQRELEHELALRKHLAENMRSTLSV